jgi:ethanolamine utilization protein EutQ (cupin superfamily)
MAVIIKTPARIKAAGTKKKIIDEFFGVVNSGGKNVSIAKMTSPEGWEEPGQTPEFDEYTVVLNGELKIKTRDTEFFIKAGEGILCSKGEWVCYSTPEPGGAEYISVCIPAFSPDTVHRDHD